MKKVFKMTTFIASMMMLFVTSAGRASDKDIIDTAVEAGSFKTLAAAVTAADLVETLKSKGPFTVFAPTDEAFAKLPKGTVENLLKPENKQQLIDILKYHVVTGNVFAKDVVKLRNAKTVNGQLVDIQVNKDGVKLDNASVIKTDIACSNGVIHVIDSVILPAMDNIPQTAIKAGKFKTLLAAAKAAGLIEALSSKGPITVFAPTDEAFAKLPKGTVESLLQPENKTKLVAILKYHVVAGRVYSTDALSAGKAETLQGITIHISNSNNIPLVNKAKLLTTDIDASNGVIHIIDSVLLPSDKKQAMNPRTMIENAIAKGAPLYNAGHTCECAKEYMTTVKSIIEMDDHLVSSNVRDHLKQAMSEAKKTHCSSTQAWTMRNAMNYAYKHLAQK